MEEKTSLANEVFSAGYDAAELSFDFVGMETASALVCESDPTIKEKITKALTDLNYRVTEAASGREALKDMRFHTYNLVVIGENFDLAEAGSSNEVLIYLQNLAAAARRNTFVALLSDNHRTMDNMLAFNKSVNLIINKKNIDNMSKIIKQGVEDNKAFYSVYNDSFKKMGRI